MRSSLCGLCGSSGRVGAILGFACVEVYLFKSGLADPLARAMLGTNWLLVLGGFMVVSWLASRTAMAAQSPVAQYGALAGFVLAEAIIFVPLLYMAQYYAEGVIQSAATVTLIGFAGLTLVAFTTRKDFSFLGGLLRWGFMVALVLIVAGVLFGFELRARPLGRVLMRRLRGSEIGAVLLDDYLINVQSRYSPRYSAIEEQVDRLQERIERGEASEQDHQQLFKDLDKLHELMVQNEE
ncbi:MAG: Bax inhibitor-1 family protein, partial [Acidobacteriota bacterium]